MMPVSLSIVIVNWNTGKHLRDCLSSVARCQKEGFTLQRVVVVDNASSDGSAENLDEPSLPLTIIQNLSNRGFAAACNQGAFGSTADYLLFLNPDTRLFGESLLNPIRHMGHPANATVGICGLRHVDDRNHTTVSCARFPTLRIFFGAMTGLSQLIPRIFPPHLIPPEECLVNSKVDQVIGAFFLVRRSLFVELGGFDERFFVYFEEVDFSYRALKRGYISYLLADTCVYHKGCVSSNQVRSQRLFYSLRSRIRYGFKHFSVFQGIVLAMITFAIELPARVLQSLIDLSGWRLRETCGGYGRLLTFYLKQAVK